MTSPTYTQGDYYITTDRDKLDMAVIHDFLSNHSHWSKGIPIETVRKSIDNALNFGLYHHGKQVGYARLITDYATIAYLGDVFVLPEYRGRGLSKWLMEVVMSYPDLQGLRRWVLLTSDAHGLYEKTGWKRVARPELYMEWHNPNVYKK
jgi:GNAT superfamily N-acetyltransferase